MNRFVELCNSHKDSMGILNSSLSQALRGHVFKWVDARQTLVTISAGTMQNWFLRSIKPKKPIEMVTAGLYLDFTWDEFLSCWDEFYPSMDVKDLHTALLIGYMKRHRSFSKDDYESEYWKWRSLADNAGDVSSLSTEATKDLQVKMLTSNASGYYPLMETCLAAYRSKSDRKFAHFKQAFDRREKDEKLLDPRRNIYDIAHLRHAERSIKEYLSGKNKQVKEVMSWCVHLRFTPAECHDVLIRMHRALEGNLQDCMEHEKLWQLLLESYTDSDISEPDFWLRMEEVYLGAQLEDKTAAEGLLFGLSAARSEQRKDKLFGLDCYRPFLRGSDEPALYTLRNNRSEDIQVLAKLFLLKLKDIPSGLYPAIDIESVYYRNSEDTFLWLDPLDIQGHLCQYYVPQDINTYSQLLHLFCGLVYTIATNHYYTPKTYSKPTKYPALSYQNEQKVHAVLSDPTLEYTQAKVKEILTDFVS